MSWIHIVVVAFVLGLIVVAYLSWDELKNRFGFGDSETIFLSRLQVLVGALMATNLAPVLPPSAVPYYVIVMGVIGELARRNRADDV